MNRLKQLRIRHGLSLRKLQEYTGIDFFRLAVIEKKDANLESKTIEKLADLFKVSSTYLLGKEGFVFYYDEHNQRYFPMPYEQYLNELTDDAVSFSIGDGCIRRIISIEGYKRIDESDERMGKAFDIKINTEKTLKVYRWINS